LILVDTYNNCEVESIDNLCFFGNHFIFGTYELNGKVFFVVWWLSAFWFSAWVLNKGRVHNWFRMPCDLPHATFVYVWAPDQHGVLSVNVSFIVHVLRKIRSATMASKSRGHFETIEISITSSGRHYFLYQGQRYLLNSHSLQCVSLRDGYKFHEFYQVCEYFCMFTSFDVLVAFPCITRNVFPYIILGYKLLVKVLSLF
jgi:hypothetical protein